MRVNPNNYIKNNIDLINILDREIILKCNLCAKNILYHYWKNHYFNCFNGKRVYKCNNPGCNARMIENDIRIHIKNCKYKICVCKYCYSIIYINNKELHYKNCKVINRKVSCPLVILLFLI